MSFELQGLNTTAAHTFCRLLLPILGGLPGLSGLHCMAHGGSSLCSFSSNFFTPVPQNIIKLHYNTKVSEAEMCPDESLLRKS